LGVEIADLGLQSSLVSLVHVIPEEMYHAHENENKYHADDRREEFDLSWSQQSTEAPDYQLAE
jgi:hypothetical protein